MLVGVDSIATQTAHSAALKPKNAIWTRSSARFSAIVAKTRTTFVLRRLRTRAGSHSRPSRASTRPEDQSAKDTFRMSGSSVSSERQNRPPSVER